MTCAELVELVTDYLEGSLSPPDSAEFERHIGDCHLCALYVEQMRVTIATVGRLEAESISPEVRTTLLHEFRDWHAALA